METEARNSDWSSKELARHSPLRIERLLLVAGLILGGCGDDDLPSADKAMSRACRDLLPTCLENQQTCADQDTGPTCVACKSGHFADTQGACQALKGTRYSHEFPSFTSTPGEEILGLCRSWTLNNPEELWVNAVTLEQDEASHHSNWMFVPDSEYPGPDGVWPCKERKYSQLAAAVAGGALYAQSTQARREVQKFPNGVAIRLPPKTRIISDVHILNTGNQTITGQAKLSIYALDKSNVSVRLEPFHVTYDGLDIPAHSRARFSGSCDLSEPFKTAGGGAVAGDIYYVLPHTHALGRRFFLEIFGGPNDGQSLMDIRGFNGEARGRRYDPPISLDGAKGLRFGCEFDNPTDKNVKWGFGDQEMCEALGFARSAIAFESRIDSANPTGKDGELLTFTGDCSTFAIPAKD